MKAMIFAAGLGTRLKPLTDNMPKALVPVGGIPLLEHVGKKLLSSGIDEAVINVHHFAGQIEEWCALQDWMSVFPHVKHPGKLAVRFSDEREMLLETGGAVLHARPLLEGCGSFLVHNVDILSNLDICWLEARVRPDAMATLLVSDRKTSRYLLFEPDTMRLAGWTNLNTGEIRSPYPGLDPQKCVRKAFSGIHIMSDKIFGVLEDYARSEGLYHLSDTPKFSIVDFYLSVCATSGIYGVPADSLQLIDVGKSDILSTLSHPPRFPSF